MRMGWNTKMYTGGRYIPIAELLAAGTHTVEYWGNAAEGWRPYLVSDGSGVPIGPHFSQEQGDRLNDLKEAAARAYGIQPSDVKRGRNW